MQYFSIFRAAILREGGVRVCAAVHHRVPHLRLEGAGGLSPGRLSGLALQPGVVRLHVQLKGIQP